MEEWKDIPGYKGHYEVSDQGRVKSCAREIEYPSGQVKRYKEKILSTNTPSGNGYILVALSKDLTVTYRFVHQLVLEAFVGLRPDGMEVRHLDGNKTNNCLDNLRYGTSSENEMDKYIYGSVTLGESNPASKLIADEVIEIRKLSAQGHTQKHIADIYSVSQMTVCKIVNNKTWRHLLEGSEIGGYQ